MNLQASVSAAWAKIQGMINGLIVLQHNQWKYLYRAVDSEGNTLDFMLREKRDGKAAERFFRKVLKATYTQVPRFITVDKNAAYPKAIETFKGDQTLSKTTELRQKKYLNNIIE